MKINQATGAGGGQDRPPKKEPVTQKKPKKG